EQIDVAGGIWRQSACMQAGEHSTECPWHRNNCAERTCRADRTVNRDPTKSHRGHAHRAAADAHHCGDTADSKRQRESTKATGQPVGETLCLTPEGEMECNRQRHASENKR